MENTEFLEIFYRIRACILENDIDICKEYLKLELDKLKVN